MNGASLKNILIQPQKGMSAVDREYYVMQSDFYTEGEYGAKGLQPFSMKKALEETPTYVVFNGTVNSMVGDKAIQANVGETVRLYVGNGGPNLISSFHVIGEIFDKVYLEGGTSLTQENVQTTLVPAGGSAIVDFKIEVPGTFILVDHSIFRAFNKGALGMLKVAGPEDKSVYSGKEVDRNYVEASAEHKGTEMSPKEVLPVVETDLKKRGEQVFKNACAMCHQTHGEGISGAFPPLAKSDYLMTIAKQSDRSKLVEIILKGLSGTITVNGKTYNNVMTPISGLSDEDLAGVLTYVTNSFGNSAKPFTVEEISRAKAALH